MKKSVLLYILFAFVLPVTTLQAQNSTQPKALPSIEATGEVPAAFFNDTAARRWIDAHGKTIKLTGADAVLKVESGGGPLRIKASRGKSAADPFSNLPTDKTYLKDSEFYFSSQSHKLLRKSNFAIFPSATKNKKLGPEEPLVFAPSLDFKPSTAIVFDASLAEGGGLFLLSGNKWDAHLTAVWPVVQRDEQGHLLVVGLELETERGSVLVSDGNPQTDFNEVCLQRLKSLTELMPLRRASHLNISFKALQELVAISSSASDQASQADELLKWYQQKDRSGGALIAQALKLQIVPKK